MSGGDGKSEGAEGPGVKKSYNPFKLFSTSKKKIPVGSLGEKSTFYYNEELKQWLEKGQEEAAKAKMDAGLAPPPKSAPAAAAALTPASSGSGSTVSADIASAGMPPGPPTGMPAVFAKRAINQRYVMQPQLTVSAPNSSSSSNPNLSSSGAPPIGAYLPVQPVSASPFTPFQPETSMSMPLSATPFNLLPHAQWLPAEPQPGTSSTFLPPEVGTAETVEVTRIPSNSQALFGQNQPQDFSNFSQSNGVLARNGSLGSTSQYPARSSSESTHPHYLQQQQKQQQEEEEHSSSAIHQPLPSTHTHVSSQPLESHSSSWQQPNNMHVPGRSPSIKSVSPTAAAAARALAPVIPMGPPPPITTRHSIGDDRGGPYQSKSARFSHTGKDLCVGGMHGGSSSGSPSGAAHSIGNMINGGGSNYLVNGVAVHSATGFESFQAAPDVYSRHTSDYQDIATVASGGSPTHLRLSRISIDRIHQSTVGDQVLTFENFRCEIDSEAAAVHASVQQPLPPPRVVGHWHQQGMEPEGVTSLSPQQDMMHTWQEHQQQQTGAYGNSGWQQQQPAGYDTSSWQQQPEAFDVSNSQKLPEAYHSSSWQQQQGSASGQAQQHAYGDSTAWEHPQPVLQSQDQHQDHYNSTYQQQQQQQQEEEGEVDVSSWQQQGFSPVSQQQRDLDTSYHHRRRAGTQLDHPSYPPTEPSNIQQLALATMPARSSQHHHPLPNGHQIMATADPAGIFPSGNGSFNPALYVSPVHATTNGVSSTADYFPSNGDPLIPYSMVQDGYMLHPSGASQGPSKLISRYSLDVTGDIMTQAYDTRDASGYSYAQDGYSPQDAIHAAQWDDGLGPPAMHTDTLGFGCMEVTSPVGRVSQPGPDYPATPRRREMEEGEGAEEEDPVYYEPPVYDERASEGQGQPDTYNSGAQSDTQQKQLQLQRPSAISWRNPNGHPCYQPFLPELAETPEAHRQLQLPENPTPGSTMDSFSDSETPAKSSRSRGKQVPNNLLARGKDLFGQIMNRTSPSAFKSAPNHSAPSTPGFNNSTPLDTASGKLYADLDVDDIGNEISRDGEEDFESIMHPGTLSKLDGPMPWELPTHLKHSDSFITVCVNWQRTHAGTVYDPSSLELPEGTESEAEEESAFADGGFASVAAEGMRLTAGQFPPTVHEEPTTQPASRNSLSQGDHHFWTGSSSSDSRLAANTPAKKSGLGYPARETAAGSLLGMDSSGQQAGSFALQQIPTPALTRVADSADWQDQLVNKVLQAQNRLAGEANDGLEVAEAPSKQQELQLVPLPASRLAASRPAETIVAAGGGDGSQTLHGLRTSAAESDHMAAADSGGSGDPDAGSMDTEILHTASAPPVPQHSVTLAAVSTPVALPVAATAAAVMPSIDGWAGTDNEQLDIPAEFITDMGAAAVQVLVAPDVPQPLLSQHQEAAQQQQPAWPQPLVPTHAEPLPQQQQQQQLQMFDGNADDWFDKQSPSLYGPLFAAPVSANHDVASPPHAESLSALFSQPPASSIQAASTFPGSHHSHHHHVHFDDLPQQPSESTHHWEQQPPTPHPQQQHNHQQAGLEEITLNSSLTMHALPSQHHASFFDTPLNPPYPLTPGSPRRGTSLPCITVPIPQQQQQQRFSYPQPSSPSYFAEVSTSLPSSPHPLNIDLSRAASLTLTGSPSLLLHRRMLSTRPLAVSVDQTPFVGIVTTRSTPCNSKPTTPRAADISRPTSPTTTSHHHHPTLLRSSSGSSSTRDANHHHHHHLLHMTTAVEAIADTAFLESSPSGNNSPATRDSPPGGSRSGTPPPVSLVRAVSATLRHSSMLSHLAGLEVRTPSPPRTSHRHEAESFFDNLGEPSTSQSGPSLSMPQLSSLAFTSEQEQQQQLQQGGGNRQFIAPYSEQHSTVETDPNTVTEMRTARIAQAQSEMAEAFESRLAQAEAVASTNLQRLIAELHTTHEGALQQHTMQLEAAAASRLAQSLAQVQAAAAQEVERAVSEVKAATAHEMAVQVAAAAAQLQQQQAEHAQAVARLLADAAAAAAALAQSQTVATCLRDTEAASLAVKVSQLQESVQLLTSQLADKEQECVTLEADAEEILMCIAQEGDKIKILCDALVAAGMDPELMLAAHGLSLET